MTPYDLLAYAITGAWATGGLLTVGLWATLALRDIVPGRRKVFARLRRVGPARFEISK